MTGLRASIVMAIALLGACMQTGYGQGTAKTMGHFVVKNELGKLTDIGAQKGKTVFLNFWALTCIPCRMELPTINALHEHYKNDTNVLVVAVDLDSSPSSAEYMRKNGLGLMVYNIASPTPEGLFRGILPTTMVIDKHGNIAMYKEAADKYDSPDFFAFMDKLRGQ